MYPASKTVKTELLPVLDQDGYMKPAILIQVEELVNAGIEMVVVVVMPDDLTYFERLFHEADTPENFNQLPPALQAYAKTIVNVGEKVKFVVQDKQEGFGHALLCAQELIGDDPFMLLIGHHLYRSSPSTPSVSSQMLKAYSKHKCSILGLKKTPVGDVCRFGTVGGVWLKDAADSNAEELAKATNLVEQVLADIGMSQYTERFATEKLLYSQLRELNSDELKEMGIPLGHRKRMLDHFGTLPEVPKVLRDTSMPTELRVMEVCEKPTREYAKEKLLMQDPPLPPEIFLTMFGQYVLDAKIFTYLQEHVDNNVRQQGLFNLSNALDRLRKAKGLIGVCLDGDRFNISTPQTFKQATNEFSEHK
jgi:UTP-glucose-1-phosphate uridylyltransferase